jgi:hypothetical protein
MRLDFNVLWVDDQPERVEAQIKAIERQMEKDGFRFSPKLIRSADDLKEWIAGDLFTDEIDLVLVDWDLGEQVEGQDVIVEIREVVPYKDVVFYSARNQSNELRTLAAQKGIEGVFCASREELVEEVLGVFESLVKKVLDLDHTRGIVMGATSDIDYMVNECLVAIHDLRDQAGKNVMLQQAREYIAKRIEDAVETLQGLESATSIVQFFEAHMILTAYDRLRILAGALKGEDLETVRSYRKTVTDYQNKAIPGRNMLGHQLLTPDGKPNAVTDAAGQPVTLDEMRELRKLILTARGEFRNLMTALKSQREDSIRPK